MADGIIEYITTADKQNVDDQKKFDFLYDAQTVLGSEKSKVEFKFQHKMSKLTLTFNNGEGADGLRMVSYTISGLKLDGTFNTATGVCAEKMMLLHRHWSLLLTEKPMERLIYR